MKVLLAHSTLRPLRHPACMLVQSNWFRIYYNDQERLYSVHGQKLVIKQPFKRCCTSTYWIWWFWAKQKIPFNRVKVNWAILTSAATDLLSHFASSMCSWLNEWCSMLNMAKAGIYRKIRRVVLCSCSLWSWVPFSSQNALNCHPTKSIVYSLSKFTWPGCCFTVFCCFVLFFAPLCFVMLHRPLLRIHLVFWPSWVQV